MICFSLLSVQGHLWVTETILAIEESINYSQNGLKDFKGKLQSGPPRLISINTTELVFPGNCFPGHKEETGET